MPNDKSKVGEPDRSRVTADQDYEVRYFAEKYGLSQELVEQVRDLVARVANDRDELHKAAKELRTSKRAHDRGRPVAFALTPGNIADITMAIPPLGAVDKPKRLLA